MTDYKSPWGMTDEEVSGLKRTVGGRVTEADGDEDRNHRLAGAAARLLEEKKALVDDGKTRPVYRWKPGSEVVKKPLCRRDGSSPWVAVRPCEERFEDKTYLGILVGDVALSVDFEDAGPGKEPGTRVVVMERCFYNPLILIPEIGETVLGCGSWWREIRGPDDVKLITDADINDTWYVRMLKDLAAGREKEENET